MIVTDEVGNSFIVSRNNIITWDHSVDRAMSLQEKLLNLEKA